MNDLSELRRIERLVRRFLPPHFDRESLAVDLWVRGWQEGRVVGPLEVKRRCIDLARRKRTGTLTREPPAPKPSEGSLETLDDLSKRADLTTLERRVIYLRFNQEMTYADIAQEINNGRYFSRGKISTILRGALVKLREASCEGDVDDD